MMASASETNPTGLNQSETEIEFSIRKMDPRRVDALRELAETMSLEDSGMKPKPVQMHSSFANSSDELEICGKKIRELTLAVD